MYDHDGSISAIDGSILDASHTYFHYYLDASSIIINDAFRKYLNGSISEANGLKSEVYGSI